MTAPASCAGRFPRAAWSWWLTGPSEIIAPKIKAPKRSRDSAASTVRPTSISTANVRMAKDIILRRATWGLFSLVGLGALVATELVMAEPALFQSRQIARSGEYTFGIEG